MSERCTCKCHEFYGPASAIDCRWGCGAKKVRLKATKQPQGSPYDDSITKLMDAVDSGKKIRCGER